MFQIERPGDGLLVLNRHDDYSETLGFAVIIVLVRLGGAGRWRKRSPFSQRRKASQWIAAITFNVTKESLKTHLKDCDR